MSVRVARYGSRNWAVYIGEELLCVTLYKRGAASVARKLEELTCKS